MWDEIYEFIFVAKPSNRPSLIEVWDDDKDFNEIDIYDDELVKIQRSEINKVAAKPVVLSITDVVHWVASHLYF